MTDNTQELDELKRLYRCIMHDFHDGEDREDMWVREVGLVVNKQVEAVLDRLVIDTKLTYDGGGDVLDAVVDFIVDERKKLKESK